MVGSLFGIVLCNKLGFVKEVYADLKKMDCCKIELYKQDYDEKSKAFSTNTTTDDLKQHLQSSQGSDDEQTFGSPHGIEAAADEPVVKDENSINLDTVKKILIFWGLTVPVAMGVSYGICKLLLIRS